MSTVLLEKDFGRPTEADILRPLKLGSEIKSIEYGQGRANCLLKDGRKVLIQYSTRYKKLGIRQDVVSEEDRDPKDMAHLYVYVDTFKGGTVIVGAREFTRKEVLEHCRENGTRCDASGQHYVSWNQFS